MIPQPASIRPPAWEIRASWGLQSASTAACTASYCSCVLPSNLSRKPIAIVSSLLDFRNPGEHSGGYPAAMDDLGNPISYMVLERGVAVFSSDGEELGSVVRV